MANPKNASEGMDVTKIYLFTIVSLIIASLVWLLYNYFLGLRYQKQFRQGVSDIQRILELEEKLPAKPAFNVNEIRIDNEFEFFKRTVRNLPDIEVESPPLQVENIAGVLVEEKRYVVHFDKGIKREDLARYIFKIQEAKPFLKVKSLTLQKIENVPAHQDLWKTEVYFAFRRPKNN
jgi:hypothetical protein